VHIVFPSNEHDLGVHDNASHQTNTHFLQLFSRSRQPSGYCGKGESSFFSIQ